MKHLVILFSILVPLILAQANSKATPQAKQLFAKLRQLTTTDSFIFGQEMPTTFNKRNGFNTNLDVSDSKSVVGDHPGLFGFDFHYIMYKTPGEAEAQQNAVAKALAAGAVVTWDFHQYDKSGAQDSYKASGNNRMAVKNILNRQDHAWYFQSLDRAIAILKRYPNHGMIYRPLHEMNGDWFWWGNQDPKDYINLFRQTVQYVRSKGVNNVLIAWTPNDPGTFRKFYEYYPGDDVVDIIGVDYYEPLDKTTFINFIARLTDYAINKGKIPAITEIGTRDGKSIIQNPRFWTQNVLNPILANAKARRIAYVQTWINNNWDSFPYIPYPGMTPVEAVNDFVAFYRSPKTMFLRETAAHLRAAPRAVADNSQSLNQQSGATMSPMMIGVVVGLCVVILALIAVIIVLVIKRKEVERA